MKHRFLLLNIIFLFSFGNHIFAQDEPTKPFPNRNEQSVGIMLNSNGWGLNYHYGKRTDGSHRTLYSVDFAEIKHPKEIKRSNPYFDSGKKFVFGKMNNFYVLRFSYGRFKILYDKFGKGGISINRFYQVGTDAGFIKPVYYKVLYPTSDPYVKLVVTERFNYSMHRVTDIYSKENFFYHIEETQIIPGLFARYGFNFDFSDNSYVINSVECGIQLDVFPKPIEIMANTKNTNIFLSLFVAYRYGKASEKRINYSK